MGYCFKAGAGLKGADSHTGNPFTATSSAGNEDVGNKSRYHQNAFHISADKEKPLQKFALFRDVRAQVA